MKTYARPTIDAAAVKAYSKTVGCDEEATVKAFIDTGMAELNKAISGRADGGLPQGRVIEMFGPSQAGKTALATDWMVMAQKMGGVSGFIDWERSFSGEVAENGYGLDRTAPYWVYKKPDTFEDGCDQALEYVQWVRANDIIHPEAPILIVKDSLAAAVPKSVMFNAKKKETMSHEERQRAMSDFNMRDQLALALATSHTFPKLAVYAEKYNATFLFLNQIRTDPTVMFGDPTKTPGGKSPEFYATVRMSLGRVPIFNSEKEVIGADITIKCVKSKLTPQGRSTTMRLGFDDKGLARFDKELSLADQLITAKVVPLARPGFVEWEGKQRSKNEFAEIIRAGNLTAQLNTLLYPELAASI